MSLAGFFEKARENTDGNGKFGKTRSLTHLELVSTLQYDTVAQYSTVAQLVS
jgi:hypothetical protein